MEHSVAITCPDDRVNSGRSVDDGMKYFAKSLQAFSQLLQVMKGVRVSFGPSHRSSRGTSDTLTNMYGSTTHGMVWIFEAIGIY